MNQTCPNSKLAYIHNIIHILWPEATSQVHRCFGSNVNFNSIPKNIFAMQTTGNWGRNLWLLYHPVLNHKLWGCLTTNLQSSKINSKYPNYSDCNLWHSQVLQYINLSINISLNLFLGGKVSSRWTIFGIQVIWIMPISIATYVNGNAKSTPWVWWSFFSPSYWAQTCTIAIKKQVFLLKGQ